MAVACQSIRLIGSIQVRERHTHGTVIIFGSMIYNRAIVYKRQNFPKVDVHIEQCNQTAR